MKPALQLIITTPTAVLFEGGRIRSVRATDASGSFGILANHIDLITVLEDSVVRWRDEANQVHFCALRRGVLTVANGCVVRIACREGLTGDNLPQLNACVREFRANVEDADRNETTRQMRLHAQAMRHIVGYLQLSAGASAEQKTDTISDRYFTGSL